MTQSALTNEAVVKKIKLIRYWTFVVFIIAFVVETLVLGLVARGCPGCSAGQIIGLLIANVWPMWLVTFIVCGLVFFGYPIWARRNPM